MPEAAATPVYIIGSYRSGSTLLRVLLDAHERVCSLPESKLLTSLAAVLRYPQVFRALCGMGLSRDAMMRHMGQFVNSLMMEAAAAQGKCRWVDKTPNYYRLLPFIDELFAGRALFIVIVRHPLDCIASLEEFMSQFQNHQDPEINDNIRQYGADKYGWAKLWTHVYEQIFVATRSRLDRVLFVKYEELIDAPVAVLSAVLEFIGETYSPGLVERAFKVGHLPGLGDPKVLRTRSVHKESLGRWKAWSQPETDALWEVVRSVAAPYGYSDERYREDRRNSNSVDYQERKGISSGQCF